MTAKTYTVTGMTCAHCVNSVSGEVAKVTGVENVDVDLSTGRVVVSGDDFADEQIRAAVDEAGYELVQT